MTPNYYEALEITIDSTQEDIKRAYKKMALRYHPDRNKDADAHEKFIGITEAYQVLKDNEKRFHYDTLYRRYFVYQEPKNEKRFEGEDKFQSWRKEGEQAARHYSTMSYEDFIIYVDKVKLDINYFSKIGLSYIVMGFVIVCMIVSLSLVSVEPVGGLFVIVMLGVGAYGMKNKINLLQKQYQSEKNNRFN